MTKRQTHPKNGSEAAVPQPAHQSEEQSLVDAAETSPTHQTKQEESNQPEVQDSSSREDHGASDALMESYNG